MYYKSKSFSLLVLFATAAVISFAVAWLSNGLDANGLSAVILGAIGIFALSSVVYLFDPKTHGDRATGDSSGVSDVFIALSAVPVTGLKRIFFWYCDSGCNGSNRIFSDAKIGSNFALR